MIQHEHLLARRQENIFQFMAFAAALSQALSALNDLKFFLSHACPQEWFDVGNEAEDGKHRVQGPRPCEFVVCFSRLHGVQTSTPTFKKEINDFLVGARARDDAARCLVSLWCSHCRNGDGSLALEQSGGPGAFDVGNLGPLGNFVVQRDKIACSLARSESAIGFKVGTPRLGWISVWHHGMLSCISTQLLEKK